MKIPVAEAVSRMLADLLGRACSVKPAAKPGFAEAGLVGVLVDSSEQMRALVFSDRAFAALAGAALSLVPRAVAEEAIKKNVLPENLLENHREIANVSTVLFNAINSDADHVRLKEIVAAGPTCPQAIRALLLKPSARLDLEVDIPGYGKGRLSVLA